MSNDFIQNIVIVGGGTAGWMTAAALSRHLPQNCNIKLVESDQIATVGVGEATIPVIRTFNTGLGINEEEFMRETNATFKLSIRFENWARQGDVYNHAFGYFGYPVDGVSFHNYWLKMQRNGDNSSIFDYNVPSVACDSNKFAHRQFKDDSLESRYFYAFQFDASLYAKYLRKWSEAKGVKRIEGKINSVNQDNETGFIESVVLESGSVIEGDLFIDCSGFRGLLIDETLKEKFLDWSHWLPCNRAWAVSSTYPENNTQIPPYTRARALDAGWQWRIPLQNRTGDGHVFSNQFISEDQGLNTLLENIEGETISTPKLLKFTTGKRENLWVKNCVAIGLSGGFLEPLESTSIALIQGAILLLMSNFPKKNCDPIIAKEFNRRMTQKYEESRNFLILHYNATERNDTPFWDYCRNMSIPDELKHRMEVFKHNGFVASQESDLFLEHSWLSVLIGQRITPTNYDVRADNGAIQNIAMAMNKMKKDIQHVVQSMPNHNQAISDYCAGDLIYPK